MNKSPEYLNDPCPPNWNSAVQISALLETLDPAFLKQPGYLEMYSNLIYGYRALRGDKPSKFYDTYVYLSRALENVGKYQLRLPTTIARWIIAKLDHNSFTVRLLNYQILVFEVEQKIFDRSNITLASLADYFQPLLEELSKQQQEAQQKGSTHAIDIAKCHDSIQKKYNALKDEILRKDPKAAFSKLFLDIAEAFSKLELAKVNILLDTCKEMGIDVAEQHGLKLSELVGIAVEKIKELKKDTQANSNAWIELLKIVLRNEIGLDYLRSIQSNFLYVNDLHNIYVQWFIALAENVDHASENVKVILLKAYESMIRQGLSAFTYSQEDEEIDIVNTNKILTCIKRHNLHQQSTELTERLFSAINETLRQHILKAILRSSKNIGRFIDIYMPVLIDNLTDRSEDLRYWQLRNLLEHTTDTITLPIADKESILIPIYLLAIPAKTNRLYSSVIPVLKSLKHPEAYLKAAELGSLQLFSDRDFKESKLKDICENIIRCMTHKIPEDRIGGYVELGFKLITELKEELEQYPDQEVQNTINFYHTLAQRIRASALEKGSLLALSQGSQQSNNSITPLLASSLSSAIGIEEHNALQMKYQVTLNIIKETSLELRAKDAELERLKFGL